MRGWKRLLGLTQEQIREKERLRRLGIKRAGCFTLLLYFFLALIIISILSSTLNFFNSLPLLNKILFIIFSVVLISIPILVPLLIRTKKNKIMINKYPNFKDNIINKSITEGMNLDLLTYILGEPSEKKETVIKEKIKKSLFFGKYRSNRGNIHYKLRIDLEDDIVVGWKEI